MGTKSTGLALVLIFVGFERGGYNKDAGSHPAGEAREVVASRARGRRPIAVPFICMSVAEFQQQCQKKHETNF
jgi:hypothetical protein